MVVSGASALLPLWMSWAAKLFSSKEVPFITGAVSSKGFTEVSKDTVIYCRASHRAVLPSWSLSSRSILIRRKDYRIITTWTLDDSVVLKFLHADFLNDISFQTEVNILFALEQLVEHRLIPRCYGFM